MCLQSSKFVEQPWYRVDDNLVILYSREFLEEISRLANEVEVDQNQMQILLMEENLNKRKFEYFFFAFGINTEGVFSVRDRP